MSMFPETPQLKLPLTDLSAQLQGYDVQVHPNELCKKIEINYLNCLEAYGTEKGFFKCRDYMDDLTECKFNHKQVMRYMRIQAEREKQFKEKKIAKQYSDPPRLDAQYNINQ